MAIELKDLHVLLLNLPYWEEEKISLFLMKLGVTKIFTSEDEIKNKERVLIFYTDTLKAEKTRSEQIIWICISSDYSQRFAARISCESEDLLLLRPIEQAELEVIIRSATADFLARERKRKFSEGMKSTHLDEAIRLCHAEMEDPFLKLEAMLMLRKLYDEKGEKKLAVNYLKMAFNQSRYNYKILLEMEQYLGHFSESNREYQTLLLDLITLYPTDVNKLISLFRLSVKTENFRHITEYFTLIREFDEHDPKLHKLQIATLFVTIKYYIKRNALSKVEELVKLLTPLSPPETVKADLFNYAAGLGKENFLKALSPLQNPPS